MKNKISIPTYVISLERRQDRRRHFIEKNKDKVLSWSFFNAYDAKGLGLTYNELKRIGFDTNQTWKDPMDGQHLSVGGVGCFISHFTLWETCIASNSPILILEDDVIIEDEFNYQDIINLIDEGYNLIYPGYAEMGVAKPVEGKTGLVIPDYPYWGSSYVITPDSAKILINDEIKHNIIPVDEYISNKLSELNPIAYEKRIIHQVPKKDGISDIDPHWGANRRYFQDFNVHSYNNNDNEQSLEEFVQYLPDNDVVIYYEDESKFKKYVENEISRKFLYTNSSIIRGEDDLFMPNLIEGKDDFDSEIYASRVFKIKQMLNTNKMIQMNTNNTEKIFLEIGTSNFDTLIPLVKNGWRGYCVEPIAEYVDDLSKLNQNVVISNCAISSYDGTLKMYQSVSNHEEWSRGISHAVEQQGNKILESDKWSFLMKDVINVPCYTLSTYIKRMGITHIDFLKVDVEGHENDIFDTYDWIVKPSFIKIEHIHIDDAKLRKNLENQGYIVFTEPCDLYAVGSFAPKVHTVTFGTDETMMSALYNSAKRHHIVFENLGNGLEWKGASKTDNTGGGQKINAIKKYIQNLPDNDIVMFVDGYDVFISNNINTIMQEYYKMDAKVVFAKDYKYCWPDATLAELFSDGEGVYLNSGCWIGEVKEMKHILGSEIRDDEDDQLYITKKYLSKKYDMKLDKECKIFQTTDYYDMNNVVMKDNKLYNTSTKVYPCVYHGNGGSDAKAKWKELYNNIDMSLDT